MRNDSPSSDEGLGSNAHISTDVVFQQVFASRRHCEDERLAFTIIYAAIVGGVLSFLSEAENNQETRVVLLSFLIAVTTLGLLLCLRLKNVIERTTDDIKSLLEARGPGHPITFFADGPSASGWTRWFPLVRIFPAFYGVALLLLFALLLLTW